MTIDVSVVRGTARVVRLGEHRPRRPGWTVPAKEGSPLKRDLPRATRRDAVRLGAAAALGVVAAACGSAPTPPPTPQPAAPATAQPAAPPTTQPAAPAAAQPTAPPTPAA